MIDLSFLESGSCDVLSGYFFPNFGCRLPWIMYLISAFETFRKIVSMLWTSFGLSASTKMVMVFPTDVGFGGVVSALGCGGVGKSFVGGGGALCRGAGGSEAFLGDVVGPFVDLLLALQGA